MLQEGMSPERRKIPGADKEEKLAAEGFGGNCDLIPEATIIPYLLLF